MAQHIASAAAGDNSDSFMSFLDQLPKIDLIPGFSLHNYNGFWYATRHLKATKSIESNFVARDDDIILTSSAKTGTTWLKALVYCIMNDDGPKSISDVDDPLATNHPAALVPTLEAQTFVADPNPDLSSFPSPRIFHTHIPYVSLPDSVKKNPSGCKIVYIVRNPKDACVSMWHFLNNVVGLPLDATFENYCKGIHPFGPFVDHALQYWNESLRAPEKILFLKYEDLKKDPKGEVKKLASFLGKTLDDEQTDRVISRCSIDRLKNLEVNKSGVVDQIGMPNSSYFRLGVVGDWKNILTPEMKDRLDQITNIKLEGSGLHLDDA